MPSGTIPDKIPTFKGVRLIGHHAPRYLLRLDAVCRTVATFEEYPDRDSPWWARLALKEVESLQLFKVAEHLDVLA